MNMKNLFTHFNSLSVSDYKGIIENSKALKLQLPDNSDQFEAQLSKYLANSRENAILHLSLATVCQDNENYIDALNYLDIARKTSLDIPDLYARVLSAIGWNYYWLKKYDFANRYLNDSLKTEDLERAFKALTYNRLGMVLEQLNHLDESIEICEKAVGLIQLRDSKSNYKVIHTRLAHLYRITGKVNKSISILNNLIYLFISKHWSNELFTERNNLGNILKSQGKYKESENHLFIAKKLIRNDRHKIIVYINLGELRWLQENYMDGLDYLKQAEELANPELHSEYIIYIYEFYAKIYKSMGLESAFYKNLENTKNAILKHIVYSQSINQTTQEKLDWIFSEYKSLGNGKPSTIIHKYKDEAWWKVKQQFVFNLISYHLNRYGVNDTLYNKMGMTKFNYKVIRERLNKKGFKFSNYRKKDPGVGTPLNDDMQSYLRSLRDKRYVPAFKAFEKDVFMETFKKVGYNKKKLAQKLQVSYLMVTKRMSKWIEEDG